MREAKYKAWNGKRFIYDFIVHFDGDEYRWLDNTLKGDELNAWKNEGLVQYTGFNTEQGIELCAGDIITDHVGTGVVEYVDRYAAFRVYYKDGRCKWFYDYNLKGERESIKRIGNIYETPELVPQGDK